MAVLTPNTYLNLADALHNGNPAVDGETITSIVNSGSDGGTATFTPSGNLPILRILPNGIRYAELPVGATASYFVLANASAQLSHNRAHLIGYELPAISNVDGITSKTIFATVNDTVNAKWRISHTQAQNAAPYGSALQAIDAGGNLRFLEKYNSSGGGMVGRNGSPVINCNILGIYFPTSTSIAAIMNGTDSIASVAQTAASVTTTNYNICAHPTPNSFNMNGGKLFFYMGFTGAVSAGDMADTYAAQRALFPLIIDADWDDPLWMFLGTSSPHGVNATLGRTHWQKGMITDVATNWPGGLPQYFFHFSPGTSHTNLVSMFNAGVGPIIPAGAGRPVLWFTSAQANIGSNGATGAASYAAMVSFIQDFLTDFPQGYVILDTTTPTDGGGNIQTYLDDYNTLLRAEFESTVFLSPHIYRGLSGGDFGNRAFLVDMRQNDYIGGPGNPAVAWANTPPTTFPPTFADPTTAHNAYNSDRNHRSDTGTGSFGQTQYLNEYLPAVQYLMGDINPTFLSANIDATGLILTINYDFVPFPPLLPATGATGTTLSDRTIGNGTRTGDAQYQFTLTEPALQGEVYTVSYTGGNIEDSAPTPNPLADFTNQPVTNNSTVVAAGGGTGPIGAGIIKPLQKFLYVGRIGP